MRKTCLSFLATVVVCATVLCSTQSATAQVPSIVDTMRVLDAIGAVGDTVIVQFYLRNVDTLGGYTFRIRYDPTLIEPLTDTVIDGSETYYYIESVLLRGADSFEQYGGALQGAPGVIVGAAFDLDQDTSEFFLPGSGPAFAMPWRVIPSATPQTTVIVFENDPIFPQSYNTISDIQGAIFKRPVLTTGLFTIDGEVCDCPFQGDGDLDGYLTPLDMGFVIDVLFGGGSDMQEPLCLSSRFDLDCDGFATPLDLGVMVDYLFAGGDPPCDPCTQP
jgi:hypothetical protein